MQDVFGCLTEEVDMRRKSLRQRQKKQKQIRSKLLPVLFLWKVVSQSKDYTKTDGRSAGFKHKYAFRFWISCSNLQGSGWITEDS